MIGSGGWALQAARSQLPLLQQGIWAASACSGTSTHVHALGWRLGIPCSLHTSPNLGAAQPDIEVKYGEPAASIQGPLSLYQQRREAGLYRPDPRQELTAMMLQELWDALQSGSARSRKLRGHPPSGLTMIDALQQGASGSSNPAHKHAGRPIVSSSSTSSSRSSRSTPTGKKKEKGFWAGLGNLLSGGADEDQAAVQRLHAGAHIPGLYMYGGVGVGKTMLMDLFVATATPKMQVMRTHYHDFMLTIHEQLKVYKGDVDPVLRVADSVAKRSRVLALDEFFVNDVANAMILSRLFGRLWDRGCVLVATSNCPPDDLYRGGLQRPLFMPFVDRLKAECVIHDMASTTDYRRLAQPHRGLYFTSTDRDQELYDEWEEYCEGAAVTPVQVPVKMGRTIQVDKAAGQCAFLTFQELCGRPVAAADYLALAERFHTIALSGVPVITAYNRSEAYRLVTLIDVMYEHRIRMLISADAAPFDLFENIITQSQALAHPELKAQPHIVVDDNLGFAKDRTISRLTEMQSLEYLVAHAQAHEPCNIYALQEAQSKAKAASQQ